MSDNGAKILLAEEMFEILVHPAWDSLCYRQLGCRQRTHVCEHHLEIA